MSFTAFVLIGCNTIGLETEAETAAKQPILHTDKCQRSKEVLRGSELLDSRKLVLEMLGRAMFGVYSKTTEQKTRVFLSASVKRNGHRGVCVKEFVTDDGIDILGPPEPLPEASRRLISEEEKRTYQRMEEDCSRYLYKTKGTWPSTLDGEPGIVRRYPPMTCEQYARNSTGGFLLKTTAGTVRVVTVGPLVLVGGRRVYAR